MALCTWKEIFRTRPYPNFTCLITFILTFQNNNYKYGPCGRAIGVDLLNNPDLVATDPVISFKTAIWFWMTPHSPKSSCHDVIIGRWNPSAGDLSANRLPGFGVITNIINGGLECGYGNENRVQDRIGFYRRYCGILGVSTGDNLDCGNQRSFGS
uniref:chitinase n=1 Tax=Solanum lycopersicum TaxID=4081 RepID=K4D1M8_SOLLC